VPVHPGDKPSLRDWAGIGQFDFGIQNNDFACSKGPVTLPSQKTD
jgi:hypothetical protein